MLCVFFSPYVFIILSLWLLVFGLEVLLRNELKTVYDDDGRQFNFSFNRIGVVYSLLVRNCIYEKKSCL